MASAVAPARRSASVKLCLREWKLWRSSLALHLSRNRFAQRWKWPDLLDVLEEPARDQLLVDRHRPPGVLGLEPDPGVRIGPHLEHVHAMLDLHVVYAKLAASPMWSPANRQIGNIQNLPAG
jgi:hypothetical protein